MAIYGNIFLSRQVSKPNKILTPGYKDGAFFIIREMVMVIIVIFNLTIVREANNHSIVLNKSEMKWFRKSCQKQHVYNNNELEQVKRYPIRSRYVLIYVVNRDDVIIDKIRVNKYHRLDTRFYWSAEFIKSE